MIHFKPDLYPLLPSVQNKSDFFQDFTALDSLYATRNYENLIAPAVTSPFACKGATDSLQFESKGSFLFKVCTKMFDQTSEFDVDIPWTIENMSSHKYWSQHFINDQIFELNSWVTREAETKASIEEEFQALISSAIFSDDDRKILQQEFEKYQDTVDRKFRIIKQVLKKVNIAGELTDERSNLRKKANSIFKNLDDEDASI